MFPQGDEIVIKRAGSEHHRKSEQFWRDFTLGNPNDYTLPSRFRYPTLYSRRDGVTRYWEIGFDVVHEEIDIDEADLPEDDEQLLELYRSDIDHLQTLGAFPLRKPISLNEDQWEVLKEFGFKVLESVVVAEIIQVPSLVTRRGQMGGKAVISYREVVSKGGKKLRDQAVVEASKRYQDMIVGKGYAAEGMEMPIHLKHPKPQLANRTDFVDSHKRLSGWPVWVFSKLDGERMMCSEQEGQIQKWTRSNFSFHFLTHLSQEIRLLLSYLPPSSVLDGELYNHDLPRQFCQSIWSRSRAGKTPHPHEYAMGYWLFDLVEPTNSDFKTRYSLLYQAYLRAAQEHVFTSVFVLQPILAESVEEVIQIKDYLVGQGFEGVMVRDLGPDTQYKQGPKRTWDVLKCKEWIDCDCTVTGVSDKAEGTEKGCALLNVFVSDYDLQLTGIRSRGSFEERRRWLKFPEIVIGKRCTIRFAFLTEDGQPFHPVITEVGRED